MRHTFDLTTETSKVINGHAQQIAEELDVSDKYIYGIQAGTQTDPFAKFAALYAAAVRAGCDVSHWLNRLDAIRAKYYRMEPKSVERETAKFVKESSDVPIAHIDDRPLYERLSEVTQAITQGEVLKAALIDAINQEKEQENGARTRFAGKPVSTETRNKVQAKLRVAR